MSDVLTARKALRAAKNVPPHSTDRLLGIAYMRLLTAWRSGCGVRLSPDEVDALFRMDSAIVMAAENIEEEFVPSSEGDWEPDPRPNRKEHP